jgi:hypothetical protein
MDMGSNVRWGYCNGCVHTSDLVMEKTTVYIYNLGVHAVIILQQVWFGIKVVLI